MLADEDGPFDMFEHLRTWLGVRYLGDDDGNTERYVPADASAIRRTVAGGIICRWCNSVWFGTLLAVLYVALVDTPLCVTVMTFSLALALSTVTILIDGVVPW